MTDLTQSLMSPIQARQLNSLVLPVDFIAPHYEGLSILNIPNSICQWLGAPPLSTMPPLVPEVLESIDGKIQKVLLILMDALALHRLQAWLARHPEMVWNRLIPSGTFAPLTSIVPSTTSAALTTLWTGQPAAQHGIVGYEVWLKEYGVVANMILHKPITFSGRSGSLEQAGFQPEDFLPMPKIGAHLAGHGIETHAFQHYSIAHSGLSRMFFDQAERHSVSNAVDMWVSIRQLWEQSRGQKLYTWAYWGEVDGLSHFFGPDDERAEGEFAAFSAAFEEFFLNKLSPADRKDTLVILTADHGQITTPKTAPNYDLRHHPEFTRRMHILPTGENRLAFLNIRPGQTEAVREYVQRTWPNQFTLLEPAFAVEQGLLGPGMIHPTLLDRTGDLIALAHDDAYWWWAAKKNPIVGRHGGLHPEEMLVPFLAARL